MSWRKSKSDSWNIYHSLGNSQSMYWKSLKLDVANAVECFSNALAVMSTASAFTIQTGSVAEDTDITLREYGSLTPGYTSDLDVMHVLTHVRVIDEGDSLPERFDDHVYLQAERGVHTTDGFRKLRIIHSPEYHHTDYLRGEQSTERIHLSLKHGYLSSSEFMSLSMTTQGPSHTVEHHGSPYDLVLCFYVNNWPNEAESWFERQTHWPDKKLKLKIRKIGYLLVATGNSKSTENDLEWRCSFSIAEKILFQSLTNYHRYTFVLFKALLKEYLPPGINTDGEKHLLSTYHIKTVFLWCLEDIQAKWDPRDMLGNIGMMLETLMRWIMEQYFPHYFIPSVNLLDSRRLHGREKSLISCVSAIRNDLLNKIKQSQYFMGQEVQFALYPEALLDERFCTDIHHQVMRIITGKIQFAMHKEVYDQIIVKKTSFCHSQLIQGLKSTKTDVDPQAQLLFTTLYSDPIHDTLLKEVIHGLRDQYCGCIHLAKYCMAARDGRVLPGVLHTAESLLKDTLHLDPCSGYFKLACLYIATGNFDKAMDRLHEAENNFHKDKRMDSQRDKFEGFITEIFKEFIDQVFHKLVDGKVASTIIVTWPEYIITPDLVQFELIHESSQQVAEEINEGKMVRLDCQLQWRPLSFIKLLQVVCAFKAGQSTRHQDKFVADLITSSEEEEEEDEMFSVFNIAACCYVRIRKYKSAVRMMMLGIGSKKTDILSSPEKEIMKRCAFSYRFTAYVIEKCLIKGSRVLVYKRDTSAW